MACVLIVDDEKNIRSGLALAFEDEGYDTLEAENGEVAWNIINKKSVDLVITDLRMPVISGYELLKRAASTFPTLPIIVLTGHGSIEDAVKAMQDGAIDFFTKPVDLDHIMLTAKKALNNSKIIEQNIKLTQEITTLKQKAKLSKTIIGKSEKLTKMMSTIEQVAPTKATVLITGESGVGKELVADALHSLSDRKDGPFIKVHCASLSANLLESELFGHEKGSFTGAVSQKKGRFELANGGTIFLDEIGEIDANTQVKILRVLQDRKITRLGGTTPMPINARIVAATNKNLEEMVQKGTFREDLFYRLNVVRIVIPPLRDRSDDIPLLAASIIARYNRSMGSKIEGFSPEALEALKKHNFYGNVRELENVLERAMIFAEQSVITLSDLDLRSSVIRPDVQAKQKEVLQEAVSLKEIERHAISRALQRWEGNRTHAAEELGISRRTLISKISEYGLE